MCLLEALMKLPNGPLNSTGKGFLLFHFHKKYLNIPVNELICFKVIIVLPKWVDDELPNLRKSTVVETEYHLDSQCIINIRKFAYLEPASIEKELQ